MAVVRRVPTGRWQAIIRRKGFPHQSQTFPTQAQAVAWARATEAQIDGRTFEDRSAAERTTLAELIDRYAAEITPGKRSARREQQRLRLLRQVFGQYTLLTLHREAIAQFRDRRLADGRAPGTVIKELNTLRHLVEVARRDWGYTVTNNPVTLVRRPSPGPGRDRRLRPGEFEALLGASRKSRAPLLAPIAELAVETAMRLGELLALRWQDIDLETGVARLAATKNGDPRDVPLSTRARDILRAMPRRLGEDRVFWCWRRPDSFETAWRRALGVADIKDLRFHDLRHEAVSRLFERGLNPMEVAAISGHKTLAMLRRYTHLRAVDLVRKLA